MKIFKSLKSGFFRSIKSRQGVLIVWFCFLILVSVFVIPLRGSLNAAFGTSMITDKLDEGFNLEVFTDLGSTFKTIMSFITSGFIFVLIIGFIINSFLTGGLFNSLKKDASGFSVPEFFRTGAKYFWSFLNISLIITLIINFLLVIIIGVPLIIISISETITESSAFIVGIAAVLVFLFFLPVFFLVADYARAWKVSNENRSCFRAIGFGFRQTFSKFWSSYLMMLILTLCQLLFGLLILCILQAWKPITVGGVLMLLIISQFLLYSRLLIKTWRYASVTSLMEYNMEIKSRKNQRV